MPKKIEPNIQKDDFPSKNLPTVGAQTPAKILDNKAASTVAGSLKAGQKQVDSAK